MNDQSGRTTAKATATKSPASEAPVGKASPRGKAAKPRVLPKPAVAPVVPAATAAAAADKPAPRKASAPKTTALKSAALKAAAAPRPEAEPESPAVAETPAAVETPPPAPAPAPVAAPEPVTDIPAPSVAAVAKKPAPQPALHEDAFSAVGIARLPSAESLAKPYARMMETGADSARVAYSQARESNEAFTQACFESANAASRGMASLNAQMLDLMRANADLTLGLMRSTLTAGSLSEAVKLQTSGARRAYETNAAHIKAIAEATTKLVGETTGPITQAMTKR